MWQSTIRAWLKATAVEMEVDGTGVLSDPGYMWRSGRIIPYHEVQYRNMCHTGTCLTTPAGLPAARTSPLNEIAPPALCRRRRVRVCHAATPPMWIRIIAVRSTVGVLISL